MALGLNYETADSGEIVPVVKYDGRSGRIHRVDRIDGDNKIMDITRTFRAVFDFENVETGFIEFVTGAAPSFSLTRLADGKQAVKPSDKHKPGLRILVKLHKDCGGDVREIAGTAKVFLRGMDELHNAYIEGLKANPGKLPIVILKDTIPVTSEGGGQKSTNYAPVWEITGWTARPQDLVYVPKSSAAAAPAAPASHGAPHTGSTQVAPPPAAHPAPAVQTDANDFG